MILAKKYKQVALTLLVLGFIISLLGVAIVLAEPESVEVNLRITEVDMSLGAPYELDNPLTPAREDQADTQVEVYIDDAPASPSTRNGPDNVNAFDPRDSPLEEDWVFERDVSKTVVEIIIKMFDRDPLGTKNQIDVGYEEETDNAIILFNVITGKWQVRELLGGTLWTTDDSYKYCNGDDGIVEFEVWRDGVVPKKFTLSVNPSTMGLGAETTISGKLTFFPDTLYESGVADIEIRLWDTRLPPMTHHPVSNLVDEVTTESDGSYSKVYSPTTPGPHAIMAVILGIISLEQPHDATAQLNVKPWIESVDAYRARKDVFDHGESVYVVGSLFDEAVKSYHVYVVEDVESWTEEMEIPDRVERTVESITTDSDGSFFAMIWEDVCRWGEYDIIVDVNNNTRYDPLIDALDDSDIRVTGGFFVIPEVPLGTIMASAAMIIALIAYVALPKWRRKRKYANP